MGTYDENGYQADLATVHTQTVRDYWDAELGPLDYSQTIEAATSFGAGVLANVVEQGVQIVVDMLDPRTAPGTVKDGYAAQVGITRRAATASAYIFRATVASGSHVLEAGDVLAGGGADGQATWTVDADTTITTSETLVDVTCQQTGAVAMTGATTLRVVTPQAVTVTIAYDPADGDAFTVGRIRESDALLEIRRSRSLVAVPSPTRDGIRSGMLALSWVVAASVARVSAGVIRCTVYPAPATAVQQQALVDAIGFRAVSATDSGTFDGSGTYTLADGVSTETIYWAEGGSQAVAVVVALTLLSGWTLAEVSPVVQDAIEAVFAALDVGGAISYMGVYCAIASVQGISSFTLTLNAGVANITPSLSTDFLIASPISIS